MVEAGRIQILDKLWTIKNQWHLEFSPIELINWPLVSRARLLDTVRKRPVIMSNTKVRKFNDQNITLLKKDEY